MKFMWRCGSRRDAAQDRAELRDTRGLFTRVLWSAYCRASSRALLFRPHPHPPPLAGEGVDRAELHDVVIDATEAQGEQVAQVVLLQPPWRARSLLRQTRQRPLQITGGEVDPG